MRRRTSSLAVTIIVCVFAGCGGSAPPAETPKPSEAEPAEKPEATPPAEDAEKPAEEKPAEKKPPADEPAPATTRSAKDIVTADNTLFAFEFAPSDAGKKAEEKCSEKSGDDPAKRAACMTKARNAIEGDSLIFRSEADGKWYWLTIRRAGNKVTLLHKFEFEPGEETEKSFTIKIVGRDKGSKPTGRVPKEVVVEVVGESQIAINDPTHGRMLYQAKAGLMGEIAR